jgi:hypothetical protein
MWNELNSQIYRESARRQFRLSVILIAFMAVAAVMVDHRISQTVAVNIIDPVD